MSDVEFKRVMVLMYHIVFHIEVIILKLVKKYHYLRNVKNLQMDKNSFPSLKKMIEDLKIFKVILKLISLENEMKTELGFKLL